MATLEELIVKIEADNKELKATLEESAKVTARSSKQMEDAITKFAESASKETSRFDKIMNVFAGTTLASVATKGAELAAEAFGFLKDKFVEGIEESMRYEQQITRLANSLATNGKFTQQAIDDLEKYIGAMEDLSGIDDEIIASNLAVLSSMTKLSSDGLQRAQTAALNLSSAIGVDLDTATKMIGKSSQGSTDAFKKWGIVIEESSDKGLTFEKTLTTIEKRFGDAAAGNMKTFSGVMTGIDSAFGNLFQALGDIIVKNPAIITGIKELALIIVGLKDDAIATGPAMAKSLAETLTSVTLSIGATVGFFEKFLQYMKAGFTSILVVTGGIADTINLIGDAFDDTNEKSKGFEETKNRIEILSKIVNSSGSETADKIFKIADSMQTATATMGKNFPKANAAIKNSTTSVNELTWAQQEQIKMSNEFALQMANQAVSIQGGYTLQQEAIDLSLNNQLISFDTYKEAKLASLLDMHNKELEMIQTSLINNGIGPEQARLAEIAAIQKYNNDRLKLTGDLRSKEDSILKQKLQDYSGFFGNLATLSKSSNERLAEIGKSAALVQGTIDMYAAITSAYRAGSLYGPGTAIAFATAAGVAQAGNLAKIAGVGLAGGIDSVPGVGSKDNFPAVLAPGERVVPSETNQDLTEFLARQGSQPQQQNTFNLIFNGPVWSDKATAGSDIIDAINEAAARGMGLRLLNT